MKNRFWPQAGLLLLVLLVLTITLPKDPLDPWKLISLQKISFIMLALASVQILGSIMIHFLGSRVGSVLSGFLGGLISSTVTTAHLAKSSRVSQDPSVKSEILIFLAATLAMLIEGLLLIFLGAGEFVGRPSLLLLGPSVISFVLIYLKIKDQKSNFIQKKPWQENVEILPLIKLSAFIIGILSLSKILQNFFGFQALLLLTFLVSLFEVHGSIIANVQLFNNQSLSIHDFGHLLALSVLASYTSKYFIILTLGSAQLKKEVTKLSIILLISLVISWLVATQF